MNNFLSKHVDKFAHLGVIYIITDLLSKYVAISCLQLFAIISLIILLKETYDLMVKNKASLLDILVGYIGFTLAIFL